MPRWNCPQCNKAYPTRPATCSNCTNATQFDTICPGCGGECEVSTAIIGKRAKCSCGTVFVIPPLILPEEPVFIPKESPQSPKRKKSALAELNSSVLLSGFGAIAAVAIVVALVVGLWSEVISPSPENLESRFEAIAKKYDGDDSKRAVFWIEYREAGHGSWAEVDEIFQRPQNFSDETSKAYKKWRAAMTARGLPNKKESVEKAKLRAIGSIKFSGIYGNGLLDAVKKNEDALALGAFNPHVFAEETRAACAAYLKVKQAE